MVEQTWLLLLAVGGAKKYCNTFRENNVTISDGNAKIQTCQTTKKQPIFIFLSSDKPVFIVHSFWLKGFRE